MGTKLLHHRDIILLFTKDGQIVRCLETTLKHALKKNKCKFVLFPVHPFEDITQYIVVDPKSIPLDLTNVELSYLLNVIRIDMNEEEDTILPVSHINRQLIRGEGLLFFYQMVASIISVGAFANHSVSAIGDVKLLLDLQQIHFTFKHPVTLKNVTVELCGIFDTSKMDFNIDNFLCELNDAMSVIFDIDDFKVISSKLDDVDYTVNLYNMTFDKKCSNDLFEQKYRELVYFTDWRTACMLPIDDVSMIVNGRLKAFNISHLVYDYYGNTNDLPYDIDINNPEDILDIDGFEVYSDDSFDYPYKYGVLEFICNIHLIYQYMEILFTDGVPPDNILFVIRCTDKYRNTPVSFSFVKKDVYSPVNLFDAFFNAVRGNVNTDKILLNSLLSNDHDPF